MSYTVRLRRDGSTVYTFSTTPFVAPTLAPDYDDQEPPAVCGVRKTWRLRGKLYGAGTGAEAATITAYDALKQFFDGSVDQVDGIELLRDGTVVESITVAGGYTGFKLLELGSPESDLQWRGEMLFTVVVEGYKRVAVSGTIAKLAQTETWNYSPEGLLTRTLEGEVEVTTGSAEEIARTLGLTLPGNDFAFETNGPEGVDVTTLGRDDLRAKFRSVIAESGRLLPANVAADFSVRTRTETVDGKTRTLILVSARGVGAASAVRAQVPPGATSVVYEDDPYRLASTAIIEQVAAAPSPSQGGDPTIVVKQTFSVTKSGEETRWTRRTGKRPPLKHTTSLGPVEVIEENRIEIPGQLPGSASILIPTPLSGVNENLGRWTMIGPNREKPGVSSSGDQWLCVIRRVYSVASLQEVIVALLQQAMRPANGTSLEQEFTRHGAILS